MLIPKADMVALVKSIGLNPWEVKKVTIDSEYTVYEPVAHITDNAAVCAWLEAHRISSKDVALVELDHDTITVTRMKLDAHGQALYTLSPINGLELVFESEVYDIEQANNDN